jgi:hypothetical protein
MQYIILISIFLSNILLFAQEESHSDSQFPLGTFLRLPPDNPTGYQSLHKSDFNTVIQHVNSNTLEWLKDYDVIVENGASPDDIINHYATGYYTKWDAEKNRSNERRTGLKHRFGLPKKWKNSSCWSSMGLRGRGLVPSLVYGPNYRQDKKYRQMYYKNQYVNYTASFRMALDNSLNKTSPDENVCVIKVVYKYTELYNTEPATWKVRDQVLASKTLKVKHFLKNGEFKDFELSYSYEDMIENKAADIRHIDKHEKNGIQFQVDWLDPIADLYIDFIEVYDNKVWIDFIKNREAAAKRVKDYTKKHLKYKNIKYWYACDEPNAIDAFTPMYIVDSLVRDAGGPPMITEFYPPWDVNVNGDVFMEKYHEMVRPQQLMIDYYPVSAQSNPPWNVRLESLRKIFALAHSTQPGFWYVAQAFGWQTIKNDWCIWRKPTKAEFKVLVMLALAHGSKGIMTWAYPTRHYTTDSRCGGNFYERGIVDEKFNPTELWHVINNDLAPRLYGKLGKNLLNLNYSGNFINIGNQGKNISTKNEFDYLSIEKSDKRYHWHAGFFEQKNQPDNKHFLLTNLDVNSSVTAKLEISNTTDFHNVSFRDVEGRLTAVEKTIGYNSSIANSVNVPAGEGYLFQVAPVVKYGGRLIYDEAINENLTLKGNMIIENNATLTVNSEYYVDGNIEIKDGKIEYGEHGKIHYLNYDGLIPNDLKDTVK